MCPSDLFISAHLCEEIFEFIYIDFELVKTISFIKFLLFSEVILCSYSSISVGGILSVLMWGMIL